MKIDPAMMKEINKSVDGFVKKNKMAVENARDIDKLTTKLEKLEKQVKKREAQIDKMIVRSNLIHDKYIVDLSVENAALSRRIDKLEKKR